MERHSHYTDSGRTESPDTFGSENSAIGGCLGTFVHRLAGSIIYYRDHAELGLAYGNPLCAGAEVQFPFGGVKNPETAILRHGKHSKP